VIGTDFMKLHENWKVIEDPYHEGEDIVLVPATKPDVGIIHAKKADKWGNVLAPGYDDRIVAQASEVFIATVEEIVDYNLMDDPRGGYAIPWAFVSRVVLAPRGAHPAGMENLYDIDDAHFAEYIQAAKSAEGFKTYLDKYVMGRSEEEYQAMVGGLVPAT
jgi:glutaconate CoA-transferase subunit A